MQDQYYLRHKMMKFDKTMKRGDLVKVRKGIVSEPELGIVLKIWMDTTYEDIERYHVKYFSFRSGRHEVQWANHVEVISRCEVDEDDEIG